VAPWIANVVQARYLVAALGEQASPPWWRSRATSDAGQRFFARLFPRTSLQAGLETASQAARLEHDTHLGTIGAFHLFRLPTADEAALHDFLGEPAAEALLRDVANLSSTDTRLATLARLAGTVDAGSISGPVNCGRVSERHAAATFQRLCASYLSGFQQGQVVYPYLTEGAP